MINIKHDEKTNKIVIYRKLNAEIKKMVNSLKTVEF